MKFIRITDWAEMSECHRYTVAATRHKGLFKFEGWRLNGAPDRHPGVLLGVRDNAQAARALCIADAAKASVEVA